MDYAQLKELNELSKKLINSNTRIYRRDNIWPGTVRKVFNKGQGQLPLVEFLPEEKVILVNTIIARKTDYNRITNLFPEYTIEEVKLGYPDWYFTRRLKTIRNNV